jgi:hypothetical protein
MVCRLMKLFFLMGLALATSTAPAQDKKPTEADYYRLVSFPLPKGMVFEASGMGFLDKEKNRLIACTRRGELFVVDNIYADHPMLEDTTRMVKGADGKEIEVEADEKNTITYKRMLFGLQEPLGMMVNPGKGFPDGIYLAQRAELSRLEDTNGDDRIDIVETFCNDWDISGSYHEYAFGPKMGGDGRLWITLNRPFGGGQEAKAYWRSWAVSVDNKGKMHPVCPGVRSPAGLGANLVGDMFYTDNQGDHVAAGRLAHLKEGTFHGNPIGLASANHPRSNFKIPFSGYPKRGMYWGEAVKVNPGLAAPAVWFPYPSQGKSHTDIQYDTTGGKFGPFAGQMFVGDLSTAQVLRVVLEKVGGEYQGACIPFRKGFEPPVFQMCWGKDGSMFVCGASRGWGGGRRPYGLQRCVWTGKVPFEIHDMKVTPTGFRLTFTHPIDAKTAADVKSYAMNCWTYKYYSNYGDKQHQTHNLKITKAAVGADGKSVTLTIEGLSPYFVHALKIPGLRSKEGLPLLHPEAYYTLNRIPKK